MKTLVVYDSKFGNTATVARAICDTLGHDAPVCLEAASDGPLDVEGVELLVVGGPTQAHGMSPAMRTLLETLPPDALRGMPVATFDTRFKIPRIFSGSAARRIARKLTSRGARLLAPPESFFVLKSEGPLEDGEVERATAWAAALLEKIGAGGREPALAAH